jgi:hypothetical protein
MKITFLSVCLLAFLFTFSTETYAVDFTVNLTTDQHDASNADGICDIDLAIAGEQCSLRAAVEQANNLPSNDRVLFSLPANSIITLTTANGGQIVINNSGTLEIIGTGANNLTIDGGAGTNRIFFTISTTGTISGVTLTGGDFVSGNGGAIVAQGGSMTLEGVYFTGNSATGNSGGGALFSGGTHRITNSTFSGNTAGACGGFRNESELMVVNSTISGNRSGVGGGICNFGTLTLRNVTITNNISAGSGGAIYDIGTLNFGNTIIAGNTANGGSTPEILSNGSIIISSGGNLVGDSAGDSTDTNFPVIYHPTDILDTPPLLGALQNNGGTTLTHALLLGSPAIDRGLNALAPASTDQRGLPRIVDGDGNGTAIVDIGAFEASSAPTAATVTVSGRVTTAQGRGIRNVVVTMTDSSGNTRTATTTSFGYFSFDDVAAGETYIFAARGKRFSFGQNTQVHSITEETSNINFVADYQSVFSVN